MLKPAFAPLAIVVLISAVAVAQQPVLVAQVPQETQEKPPAQKPGAQTPQEKPSIPRPDPPQPVNVRIELTITDQPGPGEPSKKTVTMLVADRQSANIRTSGWVVTRGSRRDVSINVDARPNILKDGSVQVDLGLQYQPTGTQATGGTAESAGDAAQTGLNERINTILQSGKPLLVSQAADPVSDRRISVEVKATIVR